MTNSAQYDRMIKIAILSLGAAFLIVGFNYDFNMYDEGIGLYGAERIASGDIPYRDFWTIYSPGLFYLIAGVSTVFGWSIITGRILTLVMVYILAYFCYLIAKNYSTTRLSLIPFSVVIVFYGSNAQSARAIIPTLVLMAVSVLFFLKFIENKKNKWIVLSGLSNSFVFLFRYDFGIYLFVSVVLTFIFIRFKEKSQIPNIKELKFYKLILLYSVSFLSLIILVSGYFLINVRMNDLIEQLYYVPTHIFPLFRSLPLPVPFKEIEPVISVTRMIISFWESFCFYSPFLIYIFGIGVVFLRKQTFGINKSIALLFLSVCGLMLYGQASVRSDIEHVIPTIIFSSVVLMIFLSDFKGRKIYCIGFLVIALVFSLPIYKKYQTTKNACNPDTGYVKISRAFGITASSEWKTNTELAVNYIQKVTSKNDKIFVGNARHDRLKINNATFYFLSERQSCTKYHELHPGVATTARVQKRIIEDIKLNKVNYIVLYSERYIPEPNLSGVSSRVFLLDNYIRSNFSIVREFGQYSIFRLNETNTPTSESQNSQ